MNATCDATAQRLVAELGFAATLALAAALRTATGRHRRPDGPAPTAPRRDGVENRK
ncbi:hypothetical protein AB0H42_28005 [Nocardia sp. NPDC050799]|uniref:hypothetical protein n=1 Tax=Nocardia sp. NPDC050799 TaxID=3154842 RepID=UPI0033C31F24